MNDKLYVALRRLGVFPGPARDIARRFPDEEDTHQVLIAFRSHVRETDSIPIAVWRLRNGILLTGGAAIDNFIREPPPNYPSIQPANGAPAKSEPSTFNLQPSPPEAPMQQILPLNTRTQDREQDVKITVVLPDYTTVGRPHGTIQITAALLDNGNVVINLAVRNEEKRTIYAQRWAYRPDELIYNHQARKKETLE